jgi:hypothetical protein
LFSDFCSLVCQLLGFPHHTFNRIFLQTCLDFIFNLVSTCMPNRFFVALFCIGNNIHYPGQSIVMIYHQSIEQLSIHIYHIYIYTVHMYNYQYTHTKNQYIMHRITIHTLYLSTYMHIISNISQMYKPY